MKKKQIRITLLSAVSLTFLLSACSSVEDKPLIADKISVTTVVQKSQSAEKTIIEQSKKETNEVIGLNQMIVFDDHADVVISKVQFSNRVEPSKPSSLYTYYDVESKENTYLQISGTFKNLEANDIDMTWDEPLKMRVKYQDKYNYDGFFVVEEDDGSDFDIAGYVEPLKTVKIHYLVSVPKEVENSKESLTLTISYGEDEYQMKIR